MTPADDHPYTRLTPAAVLDALDSVGLRGDGRLLQLNSYENRVFQVFLEDGPAVVAKFYRPGRWSDAQIAEEHALALALTRAEVPVVAPLPLGGAAAGGTETLAHVDIGGQPFRVAVYPLRSGHGPELDDPDTLRWLGRFIARLHAVGAQAPFHHRRTLTPAVFGHAAVAKVAALDLLPPAQAEGWLAASRQALAMVDAACPPAVRNTYRAATTGDYDLWAVFPTRESFSRAGADRRMVPESHHCPHGRPTSLVLSRQELDRQFRRT
jgi:Ser/Thr protein kinase RdoA (MazF antagonist)